MEIGGALQVVYHEQLRELYRMQIRGGPNMYMEMRNENKHTLALDLLPF